MIRQLWVSLSVAFATILTVFAVVVLALIFFFSDNRSILRAILLSSIEENGVEELVALYERDNSWLPVIELLEEAQDNLPNNEATPVHLILSDAEGRVVYSSSATDIDTLPSDRLSSAVRLISEGMIIGYIDVDVSTWRLSRNAQVIFAEQLQNTMVAMISTAVILGIILGIVISRTLTSPLEQLADWATNFQTDHTTAPPDIDGSIEIQTLSTSISTMVMELQASEQLRRNMVADVAHELRTPLTVLQGNLYAIIDDVYPCDKEQIAVLYDQVRMLSRLVNDLHQLSQVEANQFPFKMEAIQLDYTLTDIVSQFQIQADEKDITINYRQQDSLPLIQGDLERLHQVFNNIISNALRHAYDKSEIVIQSNHEDGEVVFKITNEGDNIPSEHLPHLFERFYRVGVSRDRTSGGTGLGLAISKAIVESHQGEIAVHSNNHKTTFVIRLPIE